MKCCNIFASATTVLWPPRQQPLIYIRLILIQGLNGYILIILKIRNKSAKYRTLNQEMKGAKCDKGFFIDG